MESVDNVDKFCYIIISGNIGLSKNPEKTGVLRWIVGDVDKCYVNGIIHRWKNGKMLISMWIMWISGENSGEIKDSGSG